MQPSDHNPDERAWGALLDRHRGARLMALRSCVRAHRERRPDEVREILSVVAYLDQYAGDSLDVPVDVLEEIARWPASTRWCAFELAADATTAMRLQRPAIAQAFRAYPLLETAIYLAMVVDPQGVQSVREQMAAVVENVGLTGMVMPIALLDVLCRFVKLLPYQVEALGTE